MKPIHLAVIVRPCLLALLLVTGCDQQAQTPPKAQPQTNSTAQPAAAGGNTTAGAFEKQIREANRLLEAGQTKEALAAVKVAAVLDTNRFEAPFLATLIFLELKQPEPAMFALNSALALAPADKKAKIESLKPEVEALQKTQTPAPGAAALTGAARRQMDTLMLIIEEADKAKLDTERKKLLQEFLDKSAPFVQENPGQLAVWTLRAVAALEMNQPKTGWEAGQQMTKLGADSSDDAKVRKVMAMLDRKGWLGKEAPSPFKNVSRETPFENSLGMKFVPVAGAKFLACIWETRVKDFSAFVDATSYDATAGMFSIGSDGWKQRGDTWKNPGFDQSPQHPVCGVSWNDANKFCDWLTETERKAGRIGADDAYRLPTDAEWSAMVGPDTYPWGNEWPPSSGAGNYRDTSSYVDNHHDDYEHTAPVGSFNANRLGIYDLGGNLWECCSDYYRKDLNSEATRKEILFLDNDGGGAKYRVSRGAAWDTSARVILPAAIRSFSDPSYRGVSCGFRCVLVVGGGR